HEEPIDGGTEGVDDEAGTSPSCFPPNIKRRGSSAAVVRRRSLRLPEASRQVSHCALRSTDASSLPPGAEATALDPLLLPAKRSGNSAAPGRRRTRSRRSRSPVCPASGLDDLHGSCGNHSRHHETALRQQLLELVLRPLRPSQATEHVEVAQDRGPMLRTRLVHVWHDPLDE